MNRFAMVAGGLVAMSALNLPTPVVAADTIKVMAPLWSGFAPLVVAQDMGYFDEQDLVMDLRWEDDRSNVMAAMLRGDIDVEIRALSEYQATPRTADLPGIIIGAIDVSLGGDPVIADGTIQTVEDLRGKTVAKLPALPSLLLLEHELKQAGIDRSEVNFVDSEVADTVAVFGDVNIAAVASAEPFASQAIAHNTARKGHILVSSADYPGYVTDVIIAQNSDLEANPDKYRRFLTAVHKAVALFDKDPDLFITTAAKHYQLDADSFRASITGTLDYTSLEEARALFGSPEQKGEIYNIFDILMDLNIDMGTGSEKLVAVDKINPAVLNQVDPAAVAVE